MDPKIIADLIVKNGIKNTNLSMFSEEEKKVILELAMEIFFRQGNTESAIGLLEYLDPQKHNVLLKELGEKAFNLGNYERAAFIYDKIGDIVMATYIRNNFLKSKMGF